MIHTYRVSGMTCEHCAMHVTQAVQGITDVTSAKVDLENGTVTVDSASELDIASVAAAIDEAGYALVQ